MDTPQRRPDRWSLHDFQEMELNAPPNEKWELIDGIIHKMMLGGSLAHNEIVVNLAVVLRTALQAKGSASRVYSTNVPVVSEAIDTSTYPDIAVRCGPRVLDQKEMTDPVLLVEVLSRSTGEKDRYDKAEAYFRIPSVQHYLLVAQDRMDVTVLARGAVDWVRTRFHAPEDVVEIAALGVSLTLAEIYENVKEIVGPY